MTTTPQNNERKKILIIGSGPYSIGSSVEFDWCGVQVLRALRRMGHETIFINSNPETVSTDFDECDRLYFEELTTERVLDIHAKEKPYGVIYSTGGQIAQNMVQALHDAGVNLLGTSVDSINNCEDRELFSAMCDELGIDQPQWQAFATKDEAIAFAKEVGFPVLVRPSFVLSGAAMAVANSDVSLMGYLDVAVGQTDASVVISKFEENAKEIEFDGVAQNGTIICSAIAEHVENAGVHSGDATIVLPAQTLYTKTVADVRRITEKLVKKLNISGPFNIQFLARDNMVKVIECNLRASRSFPFASKVLGQNFIDIATQIWMGHTLTPQEIPLDRIPCVAVKAAQFSFSRLKGADPLLGVEMSSTGEVACFGETLEEAFLKSMISVGFRIPPAKSKILLTIGKLHDKVDIVPVVKNLRRLGFTFCGTEGTSAFLQAEGIDCESLHKGDEIIQVITDKKVSLVINTPNKFSSEELSDGYSIRRKAIDKNVPLITNIQLAKLLAKSIEMYPTEDTLPLKPYSAYEFTV